MKTTSYSRVHTTVRLERHEEWIEKTDKGFQFHVNQIFWDGGDRVTLSGPARTKSGERGYINRSESFAFRHITSHIRNALGLSRSAEIQKLIEGEES